MRDHGQQPNTRLCSWMSEQPRAPGTPILSKNPRPQAELRLALLVFLSLPEALSRSALSRRLRSTLFSRPLYSFDFYPVRSQQPSWLVLGPSRPVALRPSWGLGEPPPVGKCSHSPHHPALKTVTCQPSAVAQKQRWACPTPCGIASTRRGHTEQRAPDHRLLPKNILKGTLRISFEFLRVTLFSSKSPGELGPE